MSEVEVRRVRPDDWRLLRDVRLAALADTPSAFGSSHELEAPLPDEHWQASARDRSSGDRRANFLALSGGAAVGIVGGYVPDGAVALELVSMWVAPGQRGTDLAERLVDEVVGLARVGGRPAVELWVTVGNDRARRFYERCGFAALDEFAPLPSDPCKDEQRMRLDLG